MLVEVIPKEPLSFTVFHYKNPKLQHTVQVTAGPPLPAGLALGSEERRGLWPHGVFPACRRAIGGSESCELVEA